MTNPITIGLESCLEDPPELLSDARFGLLMNQASVDRRFRYAHQRLGSRFRGHLTALFSPQHGLWGAQQDNMIETPHGRETELGLPVHSLYSETRKPTAEMLAGLDCLVIDLQDVGTRVYTFVWTMLLCLEACRDAGVAVLVLDRPNPLGGLVVEGPLLQDGYHSFVGMRALPMRHGLTIGEMARLFNREIGAELQVVPMTGWLRSMTFAATGRTWVPPSPNLPRPDGVAVYPGQVLLEGTELSEGRGTTTPFELCGAPFLDPHRLARALREQDLPGVAFRPVRFSPTFQKGSGESCGGLFLHLLEAQAYRPLETTLAMLACIKKLWPESFTWRSPPYEYEEHLPPIDILFGSSSLRLALDAGAGAREVRALARLDEAAWWHEVEDCLLYAPRPR